MEFKPWHTNHIFLLFDDGGYRISDLKLRESLVLKGKARFILRGISSVFSQSSRAESAHPLKARHGENYSLDILSSPSYRTTTTKPPNQWSIEEELPSWDDIGNNFIKKREKITLYRDSKLELKSLSEIKPITISVELIKKSYNIMHEYDLSPEYLDVGKKIESRQRKFELMPSKLAVEFEKTTSEHLPKAVPVIAPNSFECWKLPSSSLAVIGYMLDIMANNRSYNESRKPPHKKWVFLNSDPVEAKLKQLEFKVLDEDFNELEFFKIKINGDKNTQSLYGKKHHVRRKRWKLSKSLLKNFEWNPFKKLSNDTLAEFFSSMDTISISNYSFSNTKITHRKIYHTSLDIIDVHQKTFELSKLHFKEGSGQESMSHSVAFQDSAPTSPAECTNDTQLCLINTSLIANKRSFFDEDFKSILEIKKKKCDDASIEDKDNENAQLSSASLLRLLNRTTNGSTKEVDPNSYEPDRQFSSDTRELPAPFSTVDTGNKKRHIIVNSAKLNHNRQIIQYLSNKTNLDVIEQRVPSECDFILNASMCIMRIELDKFFQTNGCGTLYYEGEIKVLLSEFTRVVILVQYSERIEDTDQDLFWKLRLHLRDTRIEVYLTSSSYDNIGDWVSILASEYSNEFDNKSLETSEAHEILSALGYNTFLIKELLSACALYDILFNTREKQTREWQLLTPYQCERLQRVMALEW